MLIYNIFILIPRSGKSLALLFVALIFLQTNLVKTTNNDSKLVDFEYFFAKKNLNLVNDFQNYFQIKISSFFNRSRILFNDGDLNEGCLKQLRITFESEHGNNSSFQWLIEMFDSSGEIPKGLLSGTTTSLGDFDQCLQISEKMPFQRTQYCLLTLRAYRWERYAPIRFDSNKDLLPAISSWQRDKLKLWLTSDNQVPIAIGLCLPATCLDNEKQMIALSLSDLTQHLNVSVDYCQTGENNDDTLLNLSPLILFVSLLIATVTLASFFDFLSTTQFGKKYEQHFKHIVIKLIQCFSLISNCKIVFEMRNRSDLKIDYRKLDQPAERKKVKSIRLDFLDGLRVIMICWIIVTHCTSFSHVPRLMKVSPLANFPTNLHHLKNKNWLISVYLLSVYYPVSIFFIISGFLVIYNQKGDKKCEAKWHFFRHFIKRLLRLAPTLMATMGITYYLRYIGSGPLFHQNLIEPYVEPCRTHFWYHFFMLHNMIPLDQRCGSATWYVAADFQLYLLAFVVVHLIRCRSKWFIGLLLNFGIIAVSGLLPLLISILEIGQMPNFDVYIDLKTRLPDENLRLFYYASYNHAGSFFIGVLLGQLLSSGWSFNIFVKNNILKQISLQVSIILLMSVPFAMRFIVFPNDGNTAPYSPFWVPFLFQFFSYIFNFACATFIFVSALNPSMYICQLLSAKVFRLVSRFVFCAYLLHQMLIWFSLHQLRQPFSINNVSMGSFTLMITFTTFLSSILLHLLIECPLTRISNLLLFSGGGKLSSKTLQPENGFSLPSISTTKKDYQ